ncbi:hypothetical protein QR680_011952 [Steinernema hermaphroditum]|uniref:EGF-like domain-containing protein n=1 Tax=Steinernema hermaphroditum TaxID=289476 RepID=A0AA39LZW8_9BILA|nr:hypothetical protein QR680_011952 [Steinernema hermaphroditum]
MLLSSEQKRNLKEEYDVLDMTRRYFSDAPVNCKNGGFPKGQTCICPSYFKGDTCENLVCINGGYQLDKRCVCPVGFWGQHCDGVTERQPPVHTFDQPDVTFNLYVYNEISIYNGALSLSAFINAVENDTHVQKDYKAYNYWHYTDAKHSTTGTPLPEDKMVHTTDWEEFKKDIQATTFADPNYDCTPVNLYKNVLQMIRDQRLNSTTITVFTQFPGHFHWDDYNRLQATALARGVRINFIIPDDPLLLSCNFASDEFTAMKALSVNTGGSFVIVNDQTAKNGIVPVIQMHYRTQLVAFLSEDDCSNSKFNFTADFQMKDYTVIVTSSDTKGKLDCNGECQKMNNGTQNTQFFSLQSGVSMPHSWNLKFAGPCTVQVLNDLRGVRLFQSYVQTIDMDTSYIQPVNGIPSYLRLNAEVFNGIEYVPVVEMSINSKNANFSASSTFPYIAVEQIKCDSSKPYWWSEVVIIIQDRKFHRYLPYNCFDATPDFLPTTTVATTVAPSSSSTVGATAIETPSTEATEWAADNSALTITSDPDAGNSTPAVQSTSVPDPAPTDCGNGTLPKLFIAVSCSIGEENIVNVAMGAYSAFPLLHHDAPYKSYEVVVFDIKDEKKPIVDLEAEDATNFLNIMTSSIGNLCTGAPKKSKTDVNEVLEKYVVEANLTTSPILLAVPSDDIGTIEESTLQYMAAERDIVFALIQSADQPIYGDHSELSTLTTVTGGQVFVSQEKEGSKTQEILSYLLSSVLDKKPVFVANDNQPESHEIGRIDVDGRGNVTFELTVTGLHTDLIQITIGDSNVYIAPTPDFPNNYFTKAITISESSNITLQRIAESSDYNIYIRLWEKVDDRLQLDIGDVDDGSGASLKTFIPQKNVSESILTFYDCNGNAYENAVQNAGVEPWNITEASCGASIGFVPFFCTSHQESCLVSGTEDLYSYQLIAHTQDGSHQYWGSFLCPNASTLVCQNKGTLQDGKCQCPPEFAGPECQVPNCNNNGYLYFDEASEESKCTCHDGYSGDNCEIATCDSNEIVSAALFDPIYRTLTVVMLYNDASDLKDLSEKTLKTLPDNMDPSGFENIWSYHLYAQNGAQRDVLSIGSTLDTKKISVAEVSGNSTDAIALEDTVAYALKATGHLQRGIVWVTVSPKVNLTVDPNSFYHTVAGYRQEVFVSVLGASQPDDYEHIAQALLVTGGQLMVYDKDTDNTILANILGTGASLTFYPESVAVSSSTETTVLSGQFVVISTNKVADKINTICKDLKGSVSNYICAGVANSDIKISANFTAYVSARDTTEVSVSWTFVSDAQTSDWTGVPIDQAKVKNIIVHTLGASVDESPKKGYIKRSETCLIQDDFVVDVSTAGYHRLEVPLAGGKGSRFIPYGVVAGPLTCQNGGTFADGYCTCKGPFKGADCSIPHCQNGGVLNTQGTACHCDESKYYGIACENSKGLFWWY